jgi:hypothetical protein
MIRMGHREELLAAAKTCLADEGYSIDDIGVPALTVDGAVVLVDTDGEHPTGVLGTVVQLPETPLALYPTQV